MAGNAFCGPVVVQILSAAFLCIPWASPEDLEKEASQRDALAEAMSLFS